MDTMAGDDGVTAASTATHSTLLSLAHQCHAYLRQQYHLMHAAAAAADHHQSTLINQTEQCYQLLHWSWHHCIQQNQASSSCGCLVNDSHTTNTTTSESSADAN